MSQTHAPSGLILAGQFVPCESPVYNWLDTGLEHRVGGNNKKRKPHQVVDLFVVHWTGGVGSAAVLFRTLNTRELGVEFYIDYNGDIYQFCDPVLVNTADAGYVNPRSFGVEVRCIGIPRGKTLPSGQVVYDTVLRRRVRKYVSFTDAQSNSLYNLITALQAANHPLIKIPASIPRDAYGELRRTTMTPAEVGAFKGVLGHYHISDNKVDPGTQPLEYLMSRGFQ